uniref:RING-type E3 ubiquitin transferase n=1 Tax=Nothobranchius kadleci TaxID=1051664 RepID=A0A1A8EEA3_NOTKA
MPVQAAQWTEFLSCPICYNEFDSRSHQPISLGCSHTVCKTCLHKLHRKACPFDQTPISTDIDLLPVNCALLQLVGALVPDVPPVSLSSATDVEHYEVCRLCVEELALYLKPISSAKAVANLTPSMLSRPMQRKLVTLVNCQLVEEEGRVRAVRAARSLGERTVTELILQHQNPQQLSANLWAAVRARGCQFLGPAMQEDALKLVLLALEDGSALSRKVLVLFVVQKLEARFPQASKTSIGHVVQLLYRASCFKVTKRDEDSSLMQLKEEFRTYEALRREHDAQTVHIAMEAGLRISPEQWDRIGAPAFHPHPGQPQYGPLTPAHGVYAPLYDSRRVWRPQLYHREDARSNSLPPEVLRSSVYQPPLRERFNSLDNYCSGAEHHAALHRDFGHVPLGYEGLYKRKQDQWTSIHHHHNPSRPSQSSPIFTDFGAEHVESSGGQCMGCRIRNEESLAHYSPWSYGSTGSSLSPFEPEALTHTSAHSCSKHPELDGTEGEAVSRKQWLHTLDHYRRLKEEDPIIPFSEAPIISKWGAISRASRTAYHNTDPVQATSCQGGANTTPINFKDYNHHLDHGDYRWGSRGSDSSSHSSFLESEHLCTSELDGRRTSISGEKIVSDLQVRHPTFSQDRNQAGGEQDPDRDIELELSALDLEDSDQHETNLEESLNLHSPPSQDASHLLPPPCSSPLCSSPVDEHSKTQRLTTEKVDPHLLKKMAFRKSMSPGGLASGGLGIGKLVLRTGPPQLGNASNRVCSETPGTEMLLNGS